MEHAPDCPEEHLCPMGHCRGNPECPNAVITLERYPGLFKALMRAPKNEEKAE